MWGGFDNRPGLGALYDCAIMRPAGAEALSGFAAPGPGCSSPQPLPPRAPCSLHPAARPQVRKLRDEHHQKTLGIQLAGAATFDRQAIADHAINLASTVKGNLQRSLESLGVVGGGVVGGWGRGLKGWRERR